MRADVAAMREKLALAKPGIGVLEPKFGPGRLMDIELLAQTCALITGCPERGFAAQIEAGVKGGVLSVSDQTILLKAYMMCWPLQAASRLLTESALDFGHLGLGGRNFVLRETGTIDETALVTLLDAVTDQAATVVTLRLTPALND